MGSQGVTKLVTNRIAISRTVLSSAEVHGAEVAQQLSDILFPDGVPPTLTVADFITALHGALDRTTAGMAQSDLDHAQ